MFGMSKTPKATPIVKDAWYRLNAFYDRAPDYVDLGLLIELPSNGKVKVLCVHADIDGETDFEVKYLSTDEFLPKIYSKNM
jgi:hypothetical protein